MNAILQDGAMKFHCFFFIVLHPVARTDDDMSMMAFGLNDKYTMAANQNMVQLGQSHFGFQVNIVE